MMGKPCSKNKVRGWFIPAAPEQACARSLACFYAPSPKCQRYPQGVRIIVRNLLPKSVASPVIDNLAAADEETYQEGLLPVGH